MLCEFNDAGWCYHPMGPDNGCPGWKKCPILTGALKVEELTEFHDIDIDAEMRNILRYEADQFGA